LHDGFAANSLGSSFRSRSLMCRLLANFSKGMANVVKGMPGSITSIFSEAEDFEAALHEEGALGLLVTGCGEFRARLTQVPLHRLRLSAAEEHLPRIALVAVPADMILVSLPSGGGPAPIWGGIRIKAGEIMTLGAGQRLHARTDAPCRWGAIWLPAPELVRYGSR